MTDRELLELAARAAGYVMESHHVSGGAWVYPVGEALDADDDYPGLFLWRPREDDGDALRLAVTLAIGTQSYAALGYSYAGSESVSQSTVIKEQHNGDPYAATRRAIVRAAAEIGKQMEVTK